MAGLDMQHSTLLYSTGARYATLVAQQSAAGGRGAESCLLVIGLEPTRPLVTGLEPTRPLVTGLEPTRPLVTGLEPTRPGHVPEVSGILPGRGRPVGNRPTLC